MSSQLKIGIVTSHPIQNQAPLFKALAKEANIHVFFAYRAVPKDQAEAGFNVPFDWDINLLEGYPSSYLKNISKRAGTHHFFGCDTPEISGKIEQGNFDLVCVFGWYLKTYLQAFLACKRKGIPIVVHGDSQLVKNKNMVKKYIKKIIWPHYVSKFDGYLTVGQRFKEYLVHYGAREDRMFHVPHCVDNERFEEGSKFDREERNRFRKQIGFTHDEPLIIFVGKFLDRKRPLDLIKALSLLSHKKKYVQCLFVGAGPLEEKMENAILKYEIKAKIVGFKNQSELPQYYGASDLLVLPSNDSETWGLVVNEAMACGVPAIVSDCVGCGPDLIIPGKTGDVYPMGNIQKLSSAIENLLSCLGSKEMFVAVKQKINNYSVECSKNGILKAAHLFKDGNL